MNDDPLLRDLAQAAREEREREVDQLDERWDRLAAGTLSAEEEAELRALAATSEAARLAYEAFRPLGPEFAARMVGAIQAQATAAREAPPARVLPFRRRAGWLGGALAAAVAAGLSVLFFTPKPLPRYTLDVGGGDQVWRGAPAGPPAVRVLHPGSALEITVRPQSAVSGRIEARWFVARGAEVRELAPRAEISAGGAVRLAGTLGEDLAIAPGDWTLWVVVGRPGKLPDPAVLGGHPQAGALRAAGWTAMREPVPLRVQAGR